MPLIKSEKGAVPFGFRMAADGSRMEEDPAEQDILVRIQRMKAAGRPTRQIAKAIEAMVDVHEIEKLCR
jgi:hypothetical protein